jgi:hypothetical protein
MEKAEILARSIIKNGPITNSKRRATDIEKGPVFAKPLLSELGHPQRGIRTGEYPSRVMTMLFTWLPTLTVSAELSATLRRHDGSFGNKRAK